MGKTGIKDLGVKAKRDQEIHEKAQLRGEAIWEDIENIKIASPFMDLFSVKEEILDGIIENMKLNGDDRSKPLDIWAERGVVLDGHTRLAAAQQVGILTVPIHKHSFENQADALLYALYNQRNRRNWTDAEKQKAIGLIDELRPRGRKKKAPSGANSQGKSAVVTARKIGVSTRTVERARAVAKSPRHRRAVQTGQQTISGA